MANPDIGTSQPVRQYNLPVPMTNTSDTNLVANTASSGKLILVTATAHNYGTSSANITAKRWSAAGTPMLNDTGVTGTAYGSTATGGSSVGSTAALPVPAGAGLVMFDKLPLNEAQSITFAASAANTIAVWLTITVMG